MRIAIVSFTKHIVKKDIPGGWQIVQKNPDLVICLGGDGTFLFGEQIYPNIPKVFIKHPKATCRKCKNKQPHNLKRIFSAIKKKDYTIDYIAKLEAGIKNKKIVALNDINIHYTPPCAMRFSLFLNNKPVMKEVIGDGVVISTPYGATGYYKSITGRTFNKGFGIALNNPTKKLKSLIVNRDTIIKLKVLRGPAVATADCNKKLIQLKQGDIITIRGLKQKAKILRFGKQIKLGC